MHKKMTGAASVKGDSGICHKTGSNFAKIFNKIKSHLYCRLGFPVLRIEVSGMSRRKPTRYPSLQVWFIVTRNACLCVYIYRTSVLLEAGLILPGQGFFEELKPITFHFSGDWDVNRVHDFALKMLKCFAD